eukprot:403354133
MELDIEVYFWMVDRGLFDDDQRNKVDMERNKVKLHREHGQRFENALYIGKIMLLLRKSIMKISKKPFTLDPGISNMKDQITSTVKQTNWSVVCKELKKFGIRVDGDKKAKIIEGRTQLINEILSKLFDFDNGGLQSGRFHQLDGSISDVNGYNGDLSMINSGGLNLNVSQMNNESTTSVSIDGNNSVMIPSTKKGSLAQLEPIINSNQSRQQQFLEQQDTQLSQLQSSPLTSELLSKQTTMGNQQSPLKKIVQKNNHGILNSVTSLNDINEGKDLAYAETTLEFILLSLSKSLQIKPKQSAGLLSNNHKFLMHIAVKGMKGNDFSKIQQWYLDIYQNTQLLIQLIDNEKDSNAMKLTLNILKCGLYSQNTDLAINCIRLLSKMGQEINQIGGQLQGLAWDWLISSQNGQNMQNMPQNLNDVQIPDFSMSLNTDGSPIKNQIQTLPSNESGLQSLIFCYKRFLSEGGLIEHIFPLLVHYSKDNYMEVFTHHIRNQFGLQERHDYLQFCHELMITHQQTGLYKESILNSGVFLEWLNMALRMSEMDGVNTIPERITALTYLADIWELKSDQLEAGQNGGSDTAQAILSVLKRGCRDRNRLLRVQCFELLFKLLVVFSTNRNQFAPIIYKSITFLLIEFHQEGETREQLMRHFVSLFQQIQTIPVAILCEPLIKQIEISQSGINMLQIALSQNPNPSYQFNIFDFEFFGVVVHHKRVNLQTSMQVVDLLVNVATSNIFFANSSISIILEVIHKFSRDALLHTQFSQITKQQISLLEDSEKFKNKLDQQKKKQKEQAQKQLEQTLSKNKTNKFVQNKIVIEDKQKQIDIDNEIEAQSLARQTKERLVVNLLKQVIMFGNDMMKQNMRNQLLGAYSRVDKTLRVKSSSIKYLLSLYGEDIPKMLQYFVENEQESSTNTEQIDQQLATLDTSNIDAIPQNQLVLATLEGNSSQSPSKKTNLKAAQNLERVLKDIEKVKNNLTIKQESKLLQEELKKARDDKFKAIAKKQVDNRKLYEHGVMPKEVRNYSQDVNKFKTIKGYGDDSSLQIKIIKATDVELSEIALEDEQRLIVPYDEGKASKEKQNQVLKKLKTFQLYDLRMEEQKDQDAVRFFVKKNIKIFRNLFNRYANTTGPVTQVKETFDALQQKNSLITVAEILKMLKEFQVSNLSCSKDDVIQMVRMINQVILKKKDKGQASLSVLEFEGFVEFVLQLAVHLFSFDAQMSPAEYLQRLFDHFKTISQKIGSNNAKLFEDPSQYNIGDQKMLIELNKRIQKDPSYPLPDGFQKKVDKEVVNNYSIPAGFPINESKRVVIEVLDGFLNELFGFHFLEPMSEIKEVVRTYGMSNVIPNKQARSRQNQKLSSSIDANPIKGGKYTANNRSMIGGTPVTEKSLLNIRTNKSLFKSPRPSMPEKANNLLLKPQLSVDLKLQIANAPQHIRQTVLETAYVLEEMLYSVENGLNKLPPPGYQMLQKQKIVNRVLEEKLKKQENDDKQKLLDKQKLEMRKKMLKDQLDKMRVEKGDKTKEDAEKNKLQTEKDKQQKENKEKRTREEIKKMMEQVLVKKEAKQKEDEEKKKKEEEDKKKEDERKAAARQNRSESMKKGVQGSLIERSKNMLEEQKRKAEERKESEQRNQLESQNKLKGDLEKKNKQLVKHAARGQQSRDLKEKRKEEFYQFIEQPDVKDLFALYDKSLKSQFQLACKWDSTDITKMSYNSFLKFGIKYGITPSLISSQDLIYIYKTILRGKKDQQQQIEMSVTDVEGSKLNINDFKEALIKVACLAKVKLQQSDLKSNQGGNSMNTSQILDKPGKSTSVTRSINNTLEKEFDVSGMNAQIIENFFRHIDLKLDRQTLQQTMAKGLVNSLKKFDSKITTPVMNTQKKGLASGLEKRIQELDQQKKQQAVRQSQQQLLDQSVDLNQQSLRSEVEGIQQNLRNSTDSIPQNEPVEFQEDYVEDNFQ